MERPWSGLEAAMERPWGRRPADKMTLLGHRRNYLLNEKYNSAEPSAHSDPVF